MKIAEILANVTTPLALAALCLLLGAGLLRVIAKSQNNSAFRLTIRWGFILALTLGVLANLSFVLQASFGREVRVAGTVRDDAGKPLGRAVVDIPGRGRGITDDYGAFEFSIPDSRTAETYEGVVSMDGYGSEKFTLKGPRPKESVSVSLKRPVLSADELIRLPASLAVSHYLGMPQVDVVLGFYNPMPFRLHLTNISLSVVGPNGKSVSIPMQGTYAPITQQFNPTPLTILDLEKGQMWNLGYSFFLGNTEVYGLLERAQKEFTPTNQLPQQGATIFSSALVGEFTEFMNRTMIWRPGVWRLIISCTLDGKSYTRSFQFSLAANEVDRLKSMAKYYRTGYGVLPALRLGQFSDASSTIKVDLRE